MKRWVGFNFLVWGWLLLSGCAQLAEYTKADEAVAETSLPYWVLDVPDGHWVAKISDVGEEDGAQDQAGVWAADLAMQHLLAPLNDQVRAQFSTPSAVVGDVVLLEAQVREVFRQQTRATATIDLMHVQTWFDQSAAVYYALFDLGASTQKALLLSQLRMLDAQLPDYKHATYRGSEFEQLRSLSPVLPSLEARRVFAQIWLDRFGALPALPNARMAELMDLQLSALFSRMSVSLDALTAETAAFESGLRAGLVNAGLNISARRPSLMVRYYIEQYVEGGEIVLVNDIEINHRDTGRLAHFGEELVFELAEGETNAQGLDVAYDALGRALVDLILADLYNYIARFNAHRFGREVVENGDE